jgi:hypothetical protein
MPGIIDRVQSAIGSDYAKIAQLAHETFHERMDHHGHFGRAAVETVAEVCRRHPAVVGLGAGLLVDRLLVEEARHHDAKLKDAPAAEPAADVGAKPQKKVKVKPAPVRLTKMKPGRIALEVFGGLLLLKMAASSAKIFRHKHQSEVWFAPAAKIHLFSATLCAYNLSKALRSRNVSAWRNGAILFFGTDAIKPVLKWYRKHPHLARPAAAAAQPEPVPAPVAAPIAAEPQVQAQTGGYRHAAPAQEVAAAPELAAAQAFYGMMSPQAAPPPANAANLQIVT